LLPFFSLPLSKTPTAAGTLRSKFAAALCSITPSVPSLLTDHKPLVTSLFRTTPPWSARQQRQLSFIAEFTSDIRHTPGQENVIVDALSRPPSATAQLPPLSQRPSPTLTAEDWLEEGLTAPDRPILAAIADAQPVDFSAMACAVSLPGGGGDDELLQTADHNPGSRRRDAARGRFDRGVPPARTDPT
jgi:hypothetical protein